VRDVIRDGWASICVLGPSRRTRASPSKVPHASSPPASARPPPGIFAEGPPETLRAFAWRVRTGPLDGFVAAKGVELIVDVVHLRSDRVHRQVEVAGDLRHGQAGGQVAQDAGRGLAERFAQPPRTSPSPSLPGGAVGLLVPVSRLRIWEFKAACAV
jgi:hypothetical protein